MSALPCYIWILGYLPFTQTLSLMCLLLNDLCVGDHIIPFESDHSFFFFPTNFPFSMSVGHVQLALQFSIVRLYENRELGLV